MELEHLYNTYKESSIEGRYITLDKILPFLENYKTQNQIEIIGESVLGLPIYKYQNGTGKTKILLWSQMHGNEGTTTKALLDFFNLLSSTSDYTTRLLDKFTFCCIPMLNPDGSKLYTRENANKVDLNRDAQNLTQPESKVLRMVFEDFKPDFCFNLHDQRTIFGVGDTGKPATLSFLAPSYNDTRDINSNRAQAITLIAGINDILQKYIPGQIGRFDDAFNINCVGDTFQYLGVPTVLFEAGHFPEDYMREETRKYLFMSLVSSFTILMENDVKIERIDKYLSIPQNKVVFYDFLYKNIKINYDGIEINTKFAAQYKEELFDDEIYFRAYFSKIDDLDTSHGHVEFDAKGEFYFDGTKNFPTIDEVATFKLKNGTQFVNGSLV